jgi:hypothetical protein
VWYKSGATDEEFVRTRARCMLLEDIDSPSFGFKFPLCMRAEGWTLGPRRYGRPVYQPGYVLVPQGYAPPPGYVPAPGYAQP